MIEVIVIINLFIIVLQVHVMRRLTVPHHRAPLLLADIRPPENVINSPPQLRSLDQTWFVLQHLQRFC